MIEPIVRVFGPCPGCDAWQVDIADDVPTGLPVEKPSGPQAMYLYAWRLVRARAEMLEDAVREHALECVLFEATLIVHEMGDLMPGRGAEA